MKFSVFLFVSLCAAMNSDSGESSKKETVFRMSKRTVEFLLDNYLSEFYGSLSFDIEPEMIEEAQEVFGEFLHCALVIKGEFENQKLIGLKNKLDADEEWNRNDLNALLEYKVETLKPFSDRFFNPNVFVFSEETSPIIISQSLLPKELPESIRGMVQAIEDFYYNLYQITDKSMLSEEGKVFLEAFYTPLPPSKSTKPKRKSFPVPLWFWAFSAAVGLYGVVIGIFWARSLGTHTKK